MIFPTTTNHGHPITSHPGTSAGKDACLELKPELMARAVPVVEALGKYFQG